jgi:hypothetical protein
LNILRLAAQKSGRGPLTFKNIREAIRTWYSRDKLGSISADVELRSIYNELINKVIGEKGQICFLVKDVDLSNRHLNVLYDSRLIHVVKRDIPSQADYALRYTLFRIDSGAYVDLPSGRFPKVSTKYLRHADYPVIYLRPTAEVSTGV